MHPTEIALTQYGLGDSSKGGVGSALSTTKEESDGMEDGTGRVNDRNRV